MKTNIENNGQSVHSLLGKINHHLQIIDADNTGHIISEHPKQDSTTFCSYHLKENVDFELLMKGALEEGCVECQHKIGFCYSTGLRVKQEYSKAMEWYLKSAQVLGKSQNSIGVMYDNGYGVSQDYSKAMKWYLKAAVENNYPPAQYNIGLLYVAGKGVSLDYFKAIEWLVKAAENNNVKAQYKLGMCFEFGKGVAKDYSKAIEWYLKVVANNFEEDLGFKKPEFRIRDLYLRGGNGVEKDEKRAVFWYFKGCKQGDFKFIENPFTQFAFENLDLSESPVTTTYREDEMEQVFTIRFKERDFTILGKYLQSSKYLSTMLNSNWKDLNEKEENRIVLDLRSVQDDIFKEETSNVIQIFESYVNFLTNGNNSIDSNTMDSNTKVKLIEMARYLGDDHCILRILQKESVLMRFHILQKLDLVEPLDMAIASCFARNSSLNINDLSEEITESLLNQYEMSSPAKKKIFKAFEKRFLKYPDTIRFSKLLSLLFCVLTLNIR